MAYSWVKLSPLPVIQPVIFPIAVCFALWITLPSDATARHTPRKEGMRLTAHKTKLEQGRGTPFPAPIPFATLTTIANPAIVKTSKRETWRGLLSDHELNNG
jgi:hypothetical protein